MADIVLGIDLGTTFSTAAWVNDVGLVEIIPNREGSNLTPSVVLIDKGRFIVGQEALSQAVARPKDVAQWVKREMGNEGYCFQGQYTPEQISAEILRKMVRDAEDDLDRPIKRAVITVPAYFTATPLEKTKEAGQLAGLQVEDLLHEPEAAAIHFGITDLGDGEYVLVCDLGGGTYDATVLQMEYGVLQAARTRGSCQLGGHDWTMTLMEMMASQIREQTGVDPEEDLRDWQRLYDLCEATKCQLSTVPTAKFPWSAKGKTLELEVSREHYDARCQPLINQVIDKTAEAIRACDVAMDQIKHVLLVGGSSRLPSFAATIEHLTGRKPRRTGNPDEAVARGAALVAKGYAEGRADKNRGRIVITSGTPGAAGRIVVQRRTSHALGTVAYERSGRGMEMVHEIIIPENTNIPAAEERDDLALAARQTSVQVPVVQLDCYKQVQEHLACYRVTADFSRDRDSRVRVRFEYLCDGIPRVSAFDVESGRELACEKCRYEEPKWDDPPTGEPGTVVLAIDCSGSMYGSKMEEAKQILTEIAEKYFDLGSNWSIGVVNFGGPHEIYPSKVLLPPTQSLDEIRATADRIEADGGTPMAAGLENIRHILETASGKRRALVITDGRPNSVNQSRQTAQTLKALDIQIGVVPIGDDADRSFLADIGDFHSDIDVDGSGHGMAAAVIDLLKKM